MQLDLRRLGDQLRVFREMRGISQKDLARRIGASQSAISVIESSNRIPSLQMLMRIAKELELEVIITPREVSPTDDSVQLGGPPAPGAP